MITHFAIGLTRSSPRLMMGRRAVDRDTESIPDAAGISRVLGLPIAKVRVHSPEPGGAFGGKQHPKIRAAVAFLR